ncbi:endogenous retrovirus group K member 8 Pro protein-like [Dasypus novemcinctus]|uniref:endogenous retrovirus group K member 8 Pro protein-like n=1 Tax=Dasypus novemcinctus TaxID=9361 RepID=UPI0039C986C1
MWTMPISHHWKPSLELRIDGQWLDGLLDSGAEISCVPFEVAAFNHWPLETGPQVIGATGAATSWKTSQPLHWSDREGHEGQIRPLVLSSVQTILWGRDVLSQLKARIITEAFSATLPPPL